MIFLKQDGHVPSFFHYENCEVSYQPWRHENTVHTALSNPRVITKVDI